MISEGPCGQSTARDEWSLSSLVVHDESVRGLAVGVSSVTNTWNRKRRLINHDDRIVMTWHGWRHHRVNVLLLFKKKVIKWEDYLKEALYRIWCGVNRLGDSGVKVV